MTAKEYSETIETAFAPLSGVAFSSACEQALQEGESVLQVHDGALYRVHPDGRKEFIKAVSTSVNVKSGTTVRIPS
jgi:7-cyano-7-deazaguanine synthase in queuosine biosynthesis